MSEQIVHWAIKLSEFDINYKSRAAIKVQALADFIIENTREEDLNEAPQEEVWEVYINGSPTEKGSDVGCAVVSPGGEHPPTTTHTHTH